MTTNYHTALPNGTSTAAAIETRLASLDSAIFDRQTNINTANSNIAAELTRATAAEASEAAARAGADVALSAEITNQFSNAQAAYTAADALIQAALDAADASETAARTAQYLALQTQVDALQGMSVVAGGIGVANLTRVASAATILDIGSDGATGTVNTNGAHLFVDGDFLYHTGMTDPDLNGPTGVINVISPTQYTYSTTAAAGTETPTGAWTGTLALFLDSTTAFSDGSAVAVANDQGDVHTSTVNGTPSGGKIVMDAPVPESWTGSAKASIGNDVSGSLAELIAMRAAVPGDGHSAASALRAAGSQVYDPDAFAGDTDAEKLSAVFSAASGSGGEVLIKRDFIIEGAEQVLITDPDVTVRWMGGARIIHDAAGTEARWFGTRNTSGITFIDPNVESQSAVLDNGLSIENTSQFIMRGGLISGAGRYGVTFTEATASTYTAATIAFTAPSTITDSANGLGALVVGKRYIIVGSNSNNDVHEVLTVAAGTVTVAGTLTTESAGASVQFRLAEPCDDLMVIGTRIEDCGDYGIEHFPKAPSSNLALIGVIVKDCGVTSLLAGIKAGQYTTNSLITGCLIDHCGSGFNFGNWNTLQATNNMVRNAESFGVSLTQSLHTFFDGSADPPTYESFRFANNHISREPDFAPTSAAPGINVNGLKTDGGLVLIENNFLHRCSEGICFENSLVSMPYFRVYKNFLLDTGVSRIIQLSSTVNTTNGSNVLLKVRGLNPITDLYDLLTTDGWHPLAEITGSGIPANTTITQEEITTSGTTTNGSPTLTAVASTANFVIGGGITGTGIPDGTTIIAVTINTITMSGNATATASGVTFHTNVMVMSANATATASDIIVKSGLPKEQEWIGNRFEQSIITGTATTTNGSPTLASVSNISAWSTGMYVTGTGIPGGTTVSAVNTGASTITMSANATATAAGVTIWQSVTNYLLVKGTYAKVFDNTFVGYGPYALQLYGTGIEADDNKFVNPNLMHITNRGPVFLGDTGTYTLRRNKVYLEQYGLVTYLVNDTACTNVLESDNWYSGDGASIRVFLDGTKTLYSGFMTRGGKRVFLSTAIPGAGIWRQGDTAINPTPTEAGSAASKYIVAGWICVANGTDATVWRDDRRLTGN